MGNNCDIHKNSIFFFGESTEAQPERPQDIFFPRMLTADITFRDVLNLPCYLKNNL